MLNYAINNETAERCNSLPFLINSLNMKGIKVMTKSTVSQSHTFKKNLKRRIVITPGDKFGRLTAIEEAEPYFPPNGGDHKRCIRCKCDCGKITNPHLSSLISGRTKSCGCLNRDIVSKLKKVHGQKGQPLYETWQHMRGRCLNPRNKDYSYYGGRGVTICSEWDNYLTFHKWAINNGWAKGLVIDRIHAEGNYTTENVRFVDRGVSARNTRLLQANNTSGYRGVSWLKNNKKWQANICFDRKEFYLGCFKSPEEAAREYDKKAKELGSEHPLNFPTSGEPT